MDFWDIKKACNGPPEEADELSLCFKGAKQLGSITAMTSLISLNLAFNALSNLKGIQSLLHLQQLNVSHNQLSSIAALTALTKLSSLVCCCNTISSTSALTGLHSLALLALHKNDIAAAADVQQLSYLTALRHLTLCDNPACEWDNWRHATIATLPNLQALDNMVVSTSERLAAEASQYSWSDVQQQEYSGGLQTADNTYGPGSGGGSADGGISTDSVSSYGRPADTTGLGRQSGSLRLSSRGSRNSRTAAPVNRLRVRPSVCPEVDDGTSIKDVAALLPSIGLQPLKPSTLVRKTTTPSLPSKYGYSLSKPVKTLQQQLYKASGSAAVLVRSDGSASLMWPEGTMAVTLDPEETLATGSSSGASTTAIRSYRLLAMYRSVTGVAVSFDSNGGFVQWPDGALMLVWNKRDGTAYSREGRITHRFTNRRKPPGALKENIEAQLDDHLGIVFVAGSHELQLTFSCCGCHIGLSQLHGAMLPEREGLPEAATASTASPQHALLGNHQAVQACAAADQQQQQAAVDVTAALAGLPGADDMQALLARARALMAATDLQQHATVFEEPATHEHHGVASTVSQSCLGQLNGVSTGVSDAGHKEVDVDDDYNSTRAMLERARAAIRATAAAIEGPTS